MTTIVCKSNIVLFYSDMASASKSIDLLWDEEEVTDIECMEAMLLAEERVSMAYSIYISLCKIIYICFVKKIRCTSFLKREYLNMNIFYTCVCTWLITILMSLNLNIY